MKELIDKIWNMPASEMSSYIFTILGVIAGIYLFVWLFFIIGMRRGWIERFFDWMLRIK